MVEDNINILIIGNGFDIAHGLPTRYEDFLNILRCVDGVAKNLNVSNYLAIAGSYIYNIYSYCSYNMWYTHFCDVKNKLPKKIVG